MKPKGRQSVGGSDAVSAATRKSGLPTVDSDCGCEMYAVWQCCQHFLVYSSYGDRTFAAAGPRLWNSPPVQLRNPDITYRLFRRQLKGHFFGELWTQCSVTFDMYGSALEKHLLTHLLSYLMGQQKLHCYAKTI